MGGERGTLRVGTVEGDEAKMAEMLKLSGDRAEADGMWALLAGGGAIEMSRST